MKVFEGMVTSRSSSCPLTDEGEGRMGTSDCDDLAEGFGGTGFKRDVFNAEFLERGDSKLA